MSRTDCKPLGLVLLLAAALWLALASPLASRLSQDYQPQMYFDSVARARETLGADWERIVLIGRRFDATLAVTPAHGIIQSDVYRTLPGGALYFENAGVYAVDRGTRGNVTGLGDVERRNLFLFPPSLGRVPHVAWDSQLVGPRERRLEKADEVDGVRVHRFTFGARALDETPGFSLLPDIPGRHAARTDRDDILYIHPDSRVPVDYAENGRSSFVTADRRIAGAFFEWTARFTGQTRLSRRQYARNGRRHPWLAQEFNPAALAAAGIGVLAVGPPGKRRTR